MQPRMRGVSGWHPCKVLVIPHLPWLNCSPTALHAHVYHMHMDVLHLCTAAVLDEMVEALQSMGIEVTQYHAESAHGQYEIALGHLEVGA